MISWLPIQDNHIEGKRGDTRFFIRLKKVGIFTLQALGIEPDEGKREKLLVESLYIIPKDGEKTKIMAYEHQAYAVDEMKKVAENTNTI